MAHFAEIDRNGTVLRVIVADSQEWCEQNLGGVWKQTSYNTLGGVHKQGGQPLRKNYAGVGYKYDEARDAFIPPKSSADAVLNADTCLWEEESKVPNWNEVA